MTGITEDESSVASFTYRNSEGYRIFAFNRKYELLRVDRGVDGSGGGKSNNNEARGGSADHHDNANSVKKMVRALDEMVDALNKVIKLHGELKKATGQGDYKDREEGDEEKGEQKGEEKGEEYELSLIHI